MHAAVDMRDVVLDVDGRRVLQGADLRVAPGETVVVAGMPGGGKSFLLRLALGLPGMEADRYQLRGQVRVAGRDLDPRGGAELQALRRRIGSILRQGGLIENMDIRQNITLPLTYHYQDLLDPACIESRCDAVLSDLGHAHLGGPGLRPVGLHLEERVYAALARAWVCEPFLLLLDDPCAGLSPGPARQLHRWLFDYEPVFAEVLPVAEGEPAGPVARLLTTANLSSYLEAGDRFALLWEGRVIELGSAEDVRSCDDPRLADLLVDAPGAPAVPVRTEQEAPRA